MTQFPPGRSWEGGSPLRRSGAVRYTHPRMRARWAHVVDGAKRDPAVFIPVKAA
jgi:hypothetical protein